MLLWLDVGTLQRQANRNNMNVRARKIADRLSLDKYLVHSGNQNRCSYV